MRKAIVFSICLLLVFGVALVLRPASAQQVVTWKMQASYPVGTAVMMHGVEWAKEIEKRTNGRLKVEILPPGAICDVKDIINFMSKGVFDCAITYGGFYTGMIPETDLEIGLPQGHRTWEEVKDAMYKRGLGEVIQAAYDEHNIKWWPTAADCYYHFNTNFEVKKLDDLKGKKIRALGVYGKYVQLLGASPVVVPGAEMYMAMKLGTIDGAIYGATGLQDIKLYEVVKYYTLPTAAQISLSMCINKDSLKKLPADLREIVEKTMPEIMDITSAKYIQMCKDSLNKSVEIKATAICNLPDPEVAKMRKLVAPLWDELAAKSPRMKKGVDILKTQMKDLGRPME